SPPWAGGGSTRCAAPEHARSQREEAADAAEELRAPLLDALRADRLAVFAVLLGQRRLTLGDDATHVLGHLGGRVEHRLERAVMNDEQRTRRDGAHGRSPRLPRHQRHLAEELPGAEMREDLLPLRARAYDLHLAARADEH